MPSKNPSRDIKRGESASSKAEGALDGKRSNKQAQTAPAHEPNSGVTTVNESTKQAKGKAKETQHEQHSIVQDVLALLGCTFGIYFCYLLYGMLQEHIYDSSRYSGKKFEYSLFLVFVQCSVNLATALIAVWYNKEPADEVPWKLYFSISFSYIGAMFASNLALNFVNYPTQALAKSCKLIPVMLMRIVLLGKRYSLREYLMVALVTGGISVFMLKGKVKAGSDKAADPSSWLGLGLLFASLALDGYTSPRQEGIIKQYKPTANRMMVQMNMYACLIMSVGLVVTGEMFRAINFLKEFPFVLPEMLVFSLLSAAGQSIILVTLFRFNSLVLTLITTTRKFFTILTSVVWYGHVLTTWQWGGVLMVFAGLAIDTYDKYLAAMAKRKLDKQH